MRLSPRTLVIVLCVVFALPPLLSWYLFNYTDLGSAAAGGGEHGELIVPPRPLPDWTLVDPAAENGSAVSLRGKWTLLYLLDGACGESCVQNLYKMRQLRLATGKHAGRVQRAVLVANGDRDALSREQLREYPGQLALYPGSSPTADVLSLFALTAADDPYSRRRLYLIDPQGNLMMAYAGTTEPKGIIKDLTRLLKYSRSG